SKGVIVSYRDKRTRDFASGKRIKAFSAIERAARLKLDRLEAAIELRDLGALPGNRLEALKGDRRGQCSIRINDQWRLCFEWPGGDGPIKRGDCRLPLGETHRGNQCDSPWRTSRRGVEGTRH